MTGIYKITNQINGHFYVGLSNNIERRWSEHKTPVGRSKPTVLSKAFRKYGICNFSFEMLEEVCSEYDLLERENYWIEKLRPEYNMKGGLVGNPGHALSDDMKVMISTKLKAYWKAMPETEKRKVCARLTGPRKGHSVSVATREKISTALSGRKQGRTFVEFRCRHHSNRLSGNSNGNKSVVALEGGLVANTFGSVRAAAEWAGVHPSGISAVINGRSKTSGGYAWMVNK